jgi:hypothetical protein
MMLGDDADNVHVTMPADHIVKRFLLFQSNPEIGRVVLICVPHRGSGGAEMSFAGAAFDSPVQRMPNANSLCRVRMARIASR